MKIQSTTLDLNKTSKFKISTVDLCIFMGTFFLGLMANSSASTCLNYILISYFYHRYTNKAVLGLVGFLFGSLLLGTFVFYQHILILMIFTILVGFIKIIRGNLYVFFPAIVSFVSFVASLIFEQDLFFGYGIAMITYVVSLVALKYMNVSADVFKINGLILGILCLSLVMGFKVILPSQMTLIIVITLFALLSIILDMTSLILLMILSYGIMSPPEYALGWAIGLVFSNILKDCGRGAQSFGFVLPVFLVSMRFDILMVAVFIYFVANALSYTKINEVIESTVDEKFERQQMASRERLLQHQLNQFSQIFLSIAQFFSTSNKTESKFLYGMAKSMELLSLQLKQTATSTQNESIKIYNLLKGYHFTINRVYVSEGELGQKHISLYFDNCSKEDVYEVLLPLLQMVIDRNLSLVEYESNPLLKSSVKVEFNGIKPLQVKGHIILSEKEKQQSGDTCSMYKIKQNTICTLSDGMGSGKKAKQFSKFITQLTQRLLSVGIPVEMAVKSLNSLLQLQHGETFATLDVMVFDAYHHQVFLSKSGACATYLFRNNEMIKIQGESLPLGIIEEVEADCFRLECKNNDLFIMISDGIEEKVLEEWLKYTSVTEIRTKLENALSSYQSNDDVSVLLAEVTGA